MTTYTPTSNWTDRPLEGRDLETRPLRAMEPTSFAPAEAKPADAAGPAAPEPAGAMASTPAYARKPPKNRTGLAIMGAAGVLALGGVAAVLMMQPGEPAAPVEAIPASAETARLVGMPVSDTLTTDGADETAPLVSAPTESIASTSVPAPAQPASEAASLTASGPEAVAAAEAAPEPVAAAELTSEDAAPLIEAEPLFIP